MQALQDFGLGGHHAFGRRILAQDALQLPELVAAGFVDQRSGGGVEWRDLAQCQPRAQWHQNQSRQERTASLANRREKPSEAVPGLLALPRVGRLPGPVA